VQLAGCDEYSGFEAKIPSLVIIVGLFFKVERERRDRGSKAVSKIDT
jgi:hypothetical protein